MLATCRMTSRRLSWLTTQSRRHAVQGIGIGEHVGQAFPGGGEVELAQGLDGVGPLAVVAAVEHLKHLLRMVGDVQILHRFDGIGADAGVGVLRGGFEQFLEARIFQAAHEGASATEAMRGSLYVPQRLTICLR